MDAWESARNTKIGEYLSEMDDSSYDFIGRDIWFRNGAKADIVRYRHESREFKIVGVYQPEEDENLAGQEMVKALRDIGDLLIDEVFSYEISSMRSDNIGNKDQYKIEGDYYVNSDLEETIRWEIEDLFGPDDVFESESRIKSK